MVERLCSYGCGRIAKFILKNGKFCCENIYNKCPEVRKKNRIGVLKAYKNGKLNAKENYQNLPQETKNRMAWARGKCLIKPEDLKYKKEICIDTIERMIKNKLIKLEYKCCVCGNTGIWCNKPLKLEIHHIDGNHHNNSIENLTYICPNCHTQTSSYRNKGTSRWLNEDQIKDFLEKNLPLYDNDINKLLEYQKVKNQSYVYRKYIEYYVSNKNQKESIDG